VQVPAAVGHEARKLLDAEILVGEIELDGAAHLLQELASDEADLDRRRVHPDRLPGRSAP
jgi:hypothetical protein